MSPVGDVGGVFLTRLKRQIKVGTEERSTEFRHEFFDRVAAPPSAILASVLGGALVHVVVGLALARWGAWSLAGGIGAFLFEVRPHDPGVYVGAVAVLALAGLTAATVPDSSRGADRPSDHSAHRVSRGTSFVPTLTDQALL